MTRCSGSPRPGTPGRGAGGEGEAGSSPGSAFSRMLKQT